MSVQRSWQTDNLIRAVIGVSGVLGALTLMGVLVFRQASPLAHLPWFVPLTQAFANVHGKAVTGPSHRHSGLEQ